MRTYKRIVLALLAALAIGIGWASSGADLGIAGSKGDQFSGRESKLRAHGAINSPGVSHPNEAPR